MRKIFFVVAVILLFAGCERIEVYKSGNKSGEPLEFKKGEVQCVKCTMALEGKEHSAQAVLPDGKTYFFDDPGCLALWIVDKKLDGVRLWVYTDDTHRYIDARKAHYRLGVHTPMNYGFGVYEKPVEGSVGFEEFVRMMQRGENMTNPAIRQRYMQ
jgi:nitrous oxide reductase accessory protein NosL